jgi:hypothetical protein
LKNPKKKKKKKKKTKTQTWTQNPEKQKLGFFFLELVKLLWSVKLAEELEVRIFSEI